VPQEDERLRVRYFGLFETIQRDGVIEHWKGNSKRYLYPGDGRKYRAMSTHSCQSRIITRMVAADDIGRLRREGQMAPK
jgi:hypothetical protein